MAETITTKANETEQVDANDKTGVQEQPTLSETAGRVGEARHLQGLQKFLAERQARAARLLENPEILLAAAGAISNAYAIVCDNFDPAKTAEVHALLDELKALGAVVVDRRDAADRNHRSTSGHSTT
jgi:hypothetical protein